jgi:hypothetical protein
VKNLSFRSCIRRLVRFYCAAGIAVRGARRILARLVDEHGVTTMSYSTVRDYVARRRPEILVEAGRPLEDGCVPQTHPPACEAQVDFRLVGCTDTAPNCSSRCGPSGGTLRDRHRLQRAVLQTAHVRVNLCQAAPKLHRVPGRSRLRTGLSH